MAKSNSSRRIRKCLECEVEFSIKVQPDKKYCSQKCARKNAHLRRKSTTREWVPVKCERCEKDFFVTKSEMYLKKNGGQGRKYCGQKCYLGKRWEDVPRPETKTCSGCKETKPFTSEFFAVHKRKVLRNGSGLDSQCRKCRCKYAREKHPAYRLKLKIEVLTAYSNGIPRCECCKVEFLEFLTLDHVHGGGTQERRKLGQNQIFARLRRENYPPGFRVLCFSCNWSYGCYGYCPHQKAKVHE